MLFFWSLFVEDEVDSSEEHCQQVPFSTQRYSEETMLKRSKDFYMLMNQRRTVRFFSTEPVPLEVIDNVIHTAGTYKQMNILLKYIVRRVWV